MGNRSLEHLSALEQHLELELEAADDAEAGEAAPDEALESFEQADELDDTDREAGSEDESGEPFDSFLEADRDRSFGDRLASLAAREFESEAELEVAVREVLDDMEREYFFGKLGKLVSSAGRKFIKRASGLAKNLPIAKVVSGVTSLARGNLKGMLGTLLKNGLASAIPGGALLAPMLGKLGSGALGALTRGAGRAALDAGRKVAADAGLDGLEGLDLSSLGGAEGEVGEGEYERLAELAQSAFEELASRIDERVAHPIEAAKVAQQSLESALHKRGLGRGPRAAGDAVRTRHITLRRGERLLITRG